MPALSRPMDQTLSSHLPTCLSIAAATARWMGEEATAYTDSEGRCLFRLSGDRRPLNPDWLPVRRYTPSGKPAPLQAADWQRKRAG